MRRKHAVAVDLQEKKDVREVDLATPAFFKDTDDRKRLFEFKYVDARLEIVARAHRVHIAVELLDAAALELPVEKAEQAGVLQFNAVVEGNVHARHLYERLGFVQLGIIPHGFRMKDGTFANICPYYKELS